MSSETTEPAPAQQTPVMKNFSLHIGNLPPDIGKDRVLSLVEEYHPIKLVATCFVFRCASAQVIGLSLGSMFILKRTAIPELMRSYNLVAATTVSS